MIVGTNAIAMAKFKVGDKVKVTMPRGAISEVGVVTSVNVKAEKVTVYWEKPTMVMIVDFRDLLPPF